MVLNENTTGTITTTTLEQTITNPTDGIKFRGLHIYLDAMANGDIMQIKVYTYDPVGTAYKSWITQSISNQQTDPDWFVAFLPTTQYKVTIKKTAGTNRNVNWALEVA